MRKALLFIIILFCGVGYDAFATITVTAASASICANYASTGSAPRWTTLGTMTVKEGASADLGNTTGAWSVIITLAAPTGWQFNTAVAPTLAYTSAKNITSITAGTFTSGALTFTVAGTAKTQKDVFTISGLQVQPTSTSAAAGNIKPSYLSGTTKTITTSTNFGTLTPVAPTTGTASVAIAASPSGIICSGTNVTFTATPTNGGTAPLYQWKLNGTNITGATSGAYSTTTLANGNAISCSMISNSCITSASATSSTLTMTVNPTPNVSNFTGTSATAACVNGTSGITINSNSLGAGSFTVTYDLSGANASINNTATLTTTTSTGTFTATGFPNSGSTSILVTDITSGAGCNAVVTSSSNTATFTVNPLPTAVIVAGDGTFCGGTVVTASNGGSGTIYYQGATSLGTSTATPSTSQTISSSGSYYFRAQSSAGCWGSEDTAVVVINPLPSAITGTATVCVGNTTALTDAGGGTWSVSNTNASIGASSGIVTGNVAGTAVVTYTLGTGCQATAVVTVNPLPVAISGTKSVCASATSSLSEATSGGAWSSANTSIATVNSSGVVTGVATGTALVSYTLSTGCLVSTPVSVTTSPSAIGGASAVCSGLTITLTDAVPYGTWSSGNTSVAAVNASTGVVTGGSSGTATVSYTTGCGTPVIKTITVGNSPINGILSVCPTGTTTLTDALTGGTWSSTNSTVATIGSSSGVATGVSGGTALISYTSGLCASTVTLTVNTTPTAIGGAGVVCAGSATTLSDAVPYGLWSSGATSIATIVSSTGVVSGIAAGTAIITYSTGCGTAATKVVTVNPLPSGITGTQSVCPAQTTTLSDAGGGTWASSNTAIASVNSSGVVSGVSAGTVNITYTLGTGCATLAVVTVNPLPSSISGTKVACAGLTATLSDAGGGTWSSANTGIATIASTGVATGVAAGTTTITYTLSTGCIATTPFTVNPLPSPISGTAVVCIASTTTLSDAGGGTWSSSSTAVATVNSSTGVVTGVGTGTTMITYVLGTGCAVNAVVSVNPLPSAVTGASTVCERATTSLSDATSGGAWSSSNTSVATVDASSGVVSGIAGGAAGISYSLSTGCKRGVTVTVNPRPTPAVLSGGASVCEEDTLNMSASIGGGVWVSGDTNTATIDSFTGILSGQNAGTLTITYALSNSCGDTFSTIGVIVKPLPDAGDVSGNANVCIGLTTTLSSTSSGGVWTSSNTSVATVGSSSGVVSGVASGTATISYSVTNGCGVDENDTDVVVSPLPSAISGTRVVCSGATTTLSDAGGGAWSTANTTIATVGSGTGVVTGVAAGTATITYTLSTGCNTTAVVTVNPLPGAISGTKLVCVGLTTTLSDAGGGTWSSSATSVATIGSASGVATGVAAGTSTITYKISTGCAATTILTVSALPSAISGTTTLCVSGSSTLSDAGGGTWSISSTSVATIGSSTGTVSASAVGTAVVTYTLPAGCVTTATITVKAAPSLASATNSGPVCAGATLTLTANTPANVTAYSWSGPVAITSGGTTSSATISSTTTAASGTYSVTVSNGTGAGCGVTYTTTATVNATPTASPSSNTPICKGGTVTLSANPGGGTNTYTWSGPGLSSTTAQNPTATPTVTATYSLTVSYGSGLSGCSPSTVYTTTVTVNSVPTAAPTNNGPKCTGTAVTLTANPGGSANTYSWSGPNLSSTTAQNPTATPTVTATYSLTVSYGTSNPGCSPSTVYTTSVSVTAKGVWSGASNTNWSDTNNWCGGLPLTTTDVVISGGLTNYPVLSSGIGYAHNLSLAASTTLTITAATLKVSGTISNSGSFNAIAGSIEMNGSSAQTIPASTFISNKVNNLTVNNSSGVTLGGPLQVVGVVKATSGDLTSSGNLTLLSTSAQTALIDGSGSGNVLGSVTMQRYLDTAYGYYYISSPFAAATIAGLASYINLADTFPTFYRYNEAVQSAGWFTDTTKSDTLKVLRGYAGNFGSSLAAKTISLSGTVNNGSLSYAIFNHNDTFTRGFNLVGNPYPSPIDWDATSGWTKTNVDNAVYYFNSSDTNQYTGTYSSYVGGVSSDGIANNIIPSMQGFFVHVSSGSYPVSGSLGTANGVRVTNLSPKYHRKSANDRPLLRLQATYTKDVAHTDPVVLYMDNMAVNTFDKYMDAVKLLNTDDNTPNLYAVLNDAKLSIQALPSDIGDSARVVPLGLKLEKDGPVTFSVRTLEYMPSGLHAYLYDVAAGKVQDLVTDPQYSVSIGKGRYENRFFIMFTNKDKQSIPVINSDLNAYSRDGKLFVYLVSGEADVVVNNILGQVIWKEHISGNGTRELGYKFNIPAVYVATMFSDMGKQSKKLFIGK